MRKLITLILLFPLLLSAQMGGKSTYQFLNLTTSGRIAAMGSDMFTFQDSDINAAYWNPAAIDTNMRRNLAINFVDFVTDVNYGSVAYGFGLGEKGTLVGGIRYINYGSFTKTDEAGNILGKFYAAEYALHGGYAYQIDSNFSVGAGLKFIYSSFEQYSSMGMATDWAVSYQNREKRIHTALVLSNVGFQFNPYVEGSREPVPFEIKLGFSNRLEHMPLLWHITLENLQKFDLSYDDPNNTTTDPNTGQVTQLDYGFGDKVLRHVAVGGELFTGKALNIRFGYNFRRQKEMQLSTLRVSSGFTWGFGLRIKQVRIDYSNVRYLLSNTSNHISISASLDDVFSRSKK